MRRKLTDKQAHLLAYLQQAIKREGQAPSLRQTASDLGVSHAAVAQSLRICASVGGRSSPPASSAPAASEGACSPEADSPAAGPTRDFGQHECTWGYRWMIHY